MAPKRSGMKKERKPQHSACAVWEFRFDVPCLPDGDDDYAFYQRLLPYCKSADWQLEQKPGESRMLHYGGRVSLRQKIRPGPGAMEMQKAIGGDKAIGNAAYFAPTIPANMNNANYHQKAYTQVRGPWSLKDPPKRKCSDVRWLEEAGLGAWQRHAVQIATMPPHPRLIHWWWDPQGDKRKTATQAYLKYHHDVEDLDYLPDYKDFLQFCYGFKGKKAYCINLVKSIDWADPLSRKQFNGWTGAVESLKDGRVLDGRNYPKKDNFDRPTVMVFSNQKPMFDKASLDRWVIYRIEDEGSVDVTREVIEEHLKRQNARRLHHEYEALMKEKKWQDKWERFQAANADSFMVADGIRKAMSGFEQRQAEISAKYGVEDRSRSPRRQDAEELVPLEF